eukprot:evm.model.scf_4129.1 EVM.evm.TU.scf_4129.1   scf_4129:2979-6458(-)
MDATTQLWHAGRSCHSRIQGSRGKALWLKGRPVRLTGHRRSGLGAVALLACILSDCSAYTSDTRNEEDAQTRLRAGRDVLTILAGGTLDDLDRERAFASRLLPLTAPAPPTPWKRICAAAEVQGASAVLTALAAATYEVPDIDGTVEDGCSLTRFPAGRRFSNDSINTWLASLFFAISDASGGDAPFPKVELTRYDLFHSHLILDYIRGDCALVFHAKEYPKYDKDSFPLNLGYCQKGSNMSFSEKAMNFRNFVWYKGELVALDITPGSILTQLLYPFADVVRTVFEDEFGSTVVDVNYFDQLVMLPRNKRMFIC